MTRISLEEAYDNKDVITQIVRLKDRVNEQAGGIIDTITVSGNDLVIVWENGDTQTLPLPDPVTGIGSVTGSVTAGNLTITFYFTNGTTHSFTCPLNGMATTQYVNDGLALKANDSDVVKLTGDQSVGGTKSFSVSPSGPTEPAGNTSLVNKFYVNDSTGTYVNNIVHKDGNEDIAGTKNFTNRCNLVVPCARVEDVRGSGNAVSLINFQDSNGAVIGSFYVILNADMTVSLYAAVRNSDNTNTTALIAQGVVI